MFFAFDVQEPLSFLVPDLQLQLQVHLHSCCLDTLAASSVRVPWTTLLVTNSLYSYSTSLCRDVSRSVFPVCTPWYDMSRTRWSIGSQVPVVMNVLLNIPVLHRRSCVFVTDFVIRILLAIFVIGSGRFPGPTALIHRRVSSFFSNVLVTP